MIEPIDDELRDHVDAYKALERPTAAAHAATWAAIEARITAEPAPIAASSVRRGAPLLALAAALALCLGLGAAAVRRARPTLHLEASHHAVQPAPRSPVERGALDRPAPIVPRSVEPPAQIDSAAPIDLRIDEPAPLPPRVDEPAPLTPRIDEPAPLTPRIDEPAPLTPRVDEPTPLPPRVDEPGRVRRKPRPAGAAMLRPEEVASFRRAQAALADEHHDLALRALDEHGRRYPGGFFEEERLVSRAAALCGLGRADEARAVRDAFLRERVASHLRERMRRTCSEIE